MQVSRHLRGPAADLADAGLLRGEGHDEALAAAEAWVRRLREEGRPDRCLFLPGTALEALVVAAALAPEQVVALEVEPALGFLERHTDELGLPILALPTTLEPRLIQAGLGPFDLVVCRSDDATSPGLLSAGGREIRLGPRIPAPLSPSLPWRCDPRECPDLLPEAAAPWQWIGAGGDSVVWRHGTRVAQMARHPTLARGFRREQALTAWLAPRLDLTVPALLDVQVSPTAVLALQPYQEGRASTPGDAGAPLGAQIGAFLKQLHGLDPAAAPAEAEVRLRLDTSPLQALRRLRARIASSRLLSTPEGAPFSLPPELTLRIDRFLQEEPPPAGPLTLVHGDLTPEHLRLDAAGRVTALLDWTNSGAGDPMLDLGMLAMWGGEAFLDAVLAAYGRPLSNEDWARLRFHRRRESVSLLSDLLEEGHPLEAGLPLVEGAFAEPQPRPVTAITPITTGHLGVHWTSELYGCDVAVLDDIDQITALMLQAAQIARATTVGSHFHRFAPQGVTGVVIIAESHLAIHTWPERGYAALDVFTCGDVLQAEDAFRWLASQLKATRIDSTRQVRGDPRRIETFRRTRIYRPLHPELFHYDDTFAARFMSVGEVVEFAEQVYQFQLFTPEWCAKIIQECEHHGGWITVLDQAPAAHSSLAGVEDTYEPDTTLTWEAIPGLEAVYREVIERHVRQIVEGLWKTWRLQKWDPPALRRYEPSVVAGMGLHNDAEAVAMVGHLNDAFVGGGTFFPRWGLTVGDSAGVRVGSVLVFPGGVSHEHGAHPVTAGRRYTLANSFY